MPEYCVLLSKGNHKMPAMFVGEELSSVGKNETKCHNQSSVIQKGGFNQLTSALNED